MTDYDPFDWHWIVGGDESRFWSSSAGGYVDPIDVPATRIASETELSEVLAAYGLRGPIPAPYWLYISTLIDRMNPDEADILEAVLQSPETPSKLRMLFYSSEYIDSADPLMAILNWTIWQALVPTRGDEASARADALLAEDQDTEQ